MRYILLLRGINVGGKNKVSMNDLKQLLSNEGFKNVDSYINSGNLFFNSTQNKEKCISRIEKLLKNNYDFSISFALLTKEEYLREKEELPDWWKENLARRDVLFFSCHLDTEKIIEFIDKTTFYNEVVHIGKHAIFWGKYDESEFLKTAYHKKLMKQNFYKEITIRNWNTFEKIAKIIESKE